MSTFVKYIPTLVLSFALTAVVAQKPKPITKLPPAFQKFTPPVLVSMLGIRSDSVAVFIEEAVQLVKLPLKVTDDKKNVYTISSYQFMYKRRAVTEDEETGKVTPIISNVSNLFKTTPLPALWINAITEQIKPGEELYFFDIVAKDKEGRLMFAPDLKIKIKK